MGFINVSSDKGVTTLELSRGKVNAINESLIDELSRVLVNLENADETKAIIITGKGKFFSFGFDIPEFLSYSKAEFTSYIVKFTALYAKMFIFSKPIVAALNGHTIAGACMIALTCDQRVMAESKGKISLNELSFGASVIAGAVEMLRHATGSRMAAKILLSGEMFTPQEALEMNLIDEVVPEEILLKRATEIATEMGNKSQPGFQSIKKLLRKPVVDQFIKVERDSISEFIDIWYSEKVRKNLKKIAID